MNEEQRTLEVLPTAAHVAECEWSAPFARTPPAMTFDALEEALIRFGLRGRRRASRVVAQVVAQLALATTDLGPFGPPPLSRGVTKALRTTAAELLAAGVTSDEIDQVARRKGDALRARLEALARLMRAIRERHARLKTRTRASALGSALRALNAGEWPQALAGIQHIRIRHVTDWSPARLALVAGLASALARRGGRLTVVLVEPALPLSSEAEAHVRRAFESSGGDVDLIADDEPHALAPLDAQHAATPSAEIRAIVARIEDLVSRGTPVDRIAIAGANIAGSAERWTSVMLAAGLPVLAGRDRSPLDASVTRAALELVRLDSREATTRERVASLIGSTFIDLSAFVPDVPAPSRIVEHLRHSGVRGRVREAGEDGFRARLRKLVGQYEHAGRQALAAEVQATSSALTELFRRLDQWPRVAPLVRHARELSTLLRDLRVAQAVWRPPSSAWTGVDAESGAVASRDLAMAAERRAWLALERALEDVEELGDTPGLRKETLSRADFAELLREALGAADAGRGDAPGGGVQLLDLSEVPGRRLDHVFVVHADDASLPGTDEPNLLFSDDEIRRVNAAFGRPVLDGRRSRVARTLQLAATLDSTAHVTLSWSRVDDRARPLVPTSFASLVPPDRIRALELRPLDPAWLRLDSPELDVRRAAALERSMFFDDPSRAIGPFTGEARSAAARFAALVPGSAPNPVSASVLERAANCGFQHLADWLWRVRDDEEPTEVAPPSLVGRVAHLALEHAVRAILERDLWRADAVDEALDVGMSAARAAIDELEQRTTVGHPEVWRLTRARLVSRVRRTLGEEIRRAEGQHSQPIELELGFGVPGAPLPPLKLGGVHVGGRIDRVDRSPRSLVVVDYKSSSIRSCNERLSQSALLVTQFQLPIYAEAIRLLHADTHGRSVEAQYTSLRDAGRSLTLSRAHPGSLHGPLTREVQALVGRMRRGDFPIAPASCRGCSLRPVCRIPQLEDAS